MLANGVFDFVNGEGLSSASYLDLVFLLSVALMSWRPPIAVLALLTSAAIGLLLGVGAPYVLGLAVVFGLVVYSCSIPILAIYGACIALGSLVAEGSPQHLSVGASIGIAAVGIASGMVGWSARRGRETVAALNQDVDRLTQHAATVLAEERERIADELHDIIAHDITIVVMHARALRLTTSPNLREVSLAAITNAANQAMTDIRRMLSVVQMGEQPERSALIETAPLRAQLEAVAEQLRAAGIEVHTRMPEDLTISNSVATTLRHVVNECVTNIVKHAERTSSVRIQLILSPEHVELTIWNATPPGAAAPALPTGGYGLRRMAERVQLLDGQLCVKHDHEDGWQVTVRLPRT